MNVFAVARFLPFSVSGQCDGIYRVLRESKHEYDIFYADGAESAEGKPMDDCIRCIRLEPDNSEHWGRVCIAEFQTLYAERHYDCVLTGSTWTEGVLVGKWIKENYPNIKWIVCLDRPLSGCGSVDQCSDLKSVEKIKLKTAMMGKDAHALWQGACSTVSEIQLLCTEQAAIIQADMVVASSLDMFLSSDADLHWQSKFMVVRNRVDCGVDLPTEKREGERFLFSFSGNEEKLAALVHAVNILRRNGCPYADRFTIRVFSDIPRSIIDMVLNYYLDDVFDFIPNESPEANRKLQMECDWHIRLSSGADRKAHNGQKWNTDLSSAETAAEGTIWSSDSGSIAKQIEEILVGAYASWAEPASDKRPYTQASARKLDDAIQQLCVGSWTLRNTKWPEIGASVKDKLVTVCVPAYNVQRYLERCIRTLVEHVFAPEIEILIVDDGSKDHTSDIAQEFQRRYPGIVRLIRKENGGHGSTINQAIREGNGKYFMVVDGDDWIDSSQFADLLSYIKRTNVDADIISSNYHEINMETGICRRWEQACEVQFFREYDLEELNVENVYFTLASSMIKLSILKGMGAVLQEHTFYVDVEYILFPVPYLHRVVFTDFFIYKYCQGNAEQSIHIPTMVNRYDHHERVVKRVIQYSLDHTMSDAQRTYYLSILKRLLITQYDLCLKYDTNVLRGMHRAKSFDAFLKNTVPELAQWIACENVFVRTARKYEFDYTRIRRSFDGGVLLLMRTVKSVIKRFLAG